MKKTLLVFLNGFPYENFETFFEPEYPLYSEYFDHILFVTSKYRHFKITRDLDEKKYTVIDDYTLSKQPKAVIEALPMVLFDKDFYKEIARLRKERRLTRTCLYDLFVTTACGNHRAWIANKWLQKNSEYEVTTVYSYWLNIPAYAAIKMKKKYLPNSRTVSRAHGFDLYEERYSTKYLPYQEYICQELDQIVTISQNGKEYLEDKYRTETPIVVEHLGAINHHTRGMTTQRGVIKVVSCSRVVEVKRLDRIISALGLLEDYQVEWTHIGGGELLEKIKQMTNKLPDNVKTYFTGMIPNNEIYNMYKEEAFHVFLNVSESEGIPVAVMEAMSYGIPAIATDVGGTAELIDNEKNGFLIGSEFNPQELCEKIKNIYEMNDVEYEILRKNAREKYESEFDAEKNAKRFIENYL